MRPTLLDWFASIHSYTVGFFLTSVSLDRRPHSTTKSPGSYGHALWQAVQ